MTRNCFIKINIASFDSLINFVNNCVRDSLRSRRAICVSKKVSDLIFAPPRKTYFINAILIADSKRLDCLLSTSHEYRRTMETKALLQELEEKVVQDVRQVLKSLQNDLVNTSVYSENNGNDQMNEKLTSV